MLWWFIDLAIALFTAGGLSASGHIKSFGPFIGSSIVFFGLMFGYHTYREQWLTVFRIFAPIYATASPNGDKSRETSSSDYDRANKIAAVERDSLMRDFHKAQIEAERSRTEVRNANDLLKSFHQAQAKLSHIRPFLWRFPANY